jgi:Acyl-CoA synthetases (AMP-forming)/AMP-acid ligases II
MWNLNKFGDRPALITEEDIITYHELERASEQVAEVIKERCLVFLFCANTPAAIAGYIGCLNHNIVPVMMDNSLDKELLLHLIKVYRPKYLWISKNERQDFPKYEEVFCLWDYVLLAVDNQDNLEFNLYDKLALLMSTSGSTGSPKFVRQSYENIISNTIAIAEYLHIDEDERAITTLPMNYVYGLSIINTHLYTGAALILTEKNVFQREFWQLFKEQGVTSMGGVPYTYEMLEKLRFFRMDIPSLKTLTQAGGKLNPDLHKKFAQYAEKEKKRFVVMYGAAEATARMGYLPAEKSLSKYGSMGIAIPGGRFELRDTEGNLVEEPNTIGELVYYGKNVSLGYAICGEDLILGDERRECLYTGDLAIYEDGIYTIVGRKKRFLKIFGKRINLDEVEQILKNEFSTTDLACSGIDDKLYVFSIEAAVVEKIVPYLSMKLKLHSSAFKAKHIEFIPKNASGKTLYRELEQYYD